jgi:hypothetical protein
MYQITNVIHVCIYIYVNIVAEVVAYGFINKIVLLQIYVDIFKFISINMYIFRNTIIYMYIYLLIYVYIFTYICIYIYLYMYIYLLIYVYIFTYICIYICVKAAEAVAYGVIDEVMLPPQPVKMMRYRGTVLGNAYMWIYVYIYMHLYAYIYVFIYTHEYLCINMKLFIIFVYLYVYVCIYRYQPSCCINALNCCVHYLCLRGWVYVFYVGHIDKIMKPFSMFLS